VLDRHTTQDDATFGEDGEMTQSAAARLAATLDAHRVDLIYCVPGESYLAVTDALIEPPHIRLIVCRHESGAALMAVADAQLRNKPGVRIVSRGQGATNASIAVHVADHDAVPLVLFVGQAERHDRENDTDVAGVVKAAMTTDKPVVIDGRASLNDLTAWRQLDEIGLRGGARVDATPGRAARCRE
jgi:glyoxylate carboligase